MDERAEIIKSPKRKHGFNNGYLGHQQQEQQKENQIDWTISKFKTFVHLRTLSGK